MRITVLIGNGFDLALGLKTGYADFLEKYVVEKPKDTRAIKWLKEKIKQGDSHTWADAEKAFGELPFSESVTDKKDTLEGALNEMTHDFEHELYNHLESEAKRLQLLKCDRAHMVFLNAIINTIASNNDLASKIKESKSIEIKFITFNYTDSLEKILDSLPPTCVEQISLCLCNEETNVPVQIRSVHHIHGAFDSKKSMTFGVDNDKQIQDCSTRRYCKGSRFLIKPSPQSITHSRCDTCDTAKAHPSGDWSGGPELSMAASDVIVCFGLSFGKTDCSWWTLIYDILCHDKKVMLVLMPHEIESVDGYNDLKVSQIKFSNKFMFNVKGRKKRAISNQIVFALPDKFYEKDGCRWYDPLGLSVIRDNFVFGHQTPETLHNIYVDAENGNKYAQFKWSRIRSLNKDYKESEEWLLKAANNGCREAQYAYGIKHYDEHRPNDAIEWIRKAADDGYALAEASMGLAYAVGKGFPKSFENALIWYRRAAEHGDVLSARAMYDLFNSNNTIGLLGPREARMWQQFSIWRIHPIEKRILQ